MKNTTNWPIFDGHNDVLLALYRPRPGAERGFFQHSDLGHIDLPRACSGGFGGGFFAVFVPDPNAPLTPPIFDITEGEHYLFPLPPAIELGYAQRTALGMSGLLFRLETEANGQLRVVRSLVELRSCLEAGVLAAILHFEGAEALDPDLEALDVFYQAGLRSLGLVWSRPNAFASGVPFGYGHSPDIGPGLTDAGRELVRACNRKGIMLDLSHLNERGFWDIAGLSTMPLVATHSNAYAICPSTRNLTDRQLDAIKESDGMVGVNFEVSFLRPTGGKDANLPLSVIADHIDYLVARLGIDRVGFGSDFDGATMPTALGDVAGLPNLITMLRERGYDDAALRKLTHENWLRVLAKIWKDA